MCTSAAASGQDVYVPRNDAKGIQKLIDDLAGRLFLDVKVTAVIVRTNRLLVSVEPHADRSNGFVLTLQDDFLDELSAEEVRAVVAHELGHVWIFTHHPYLQTERQANQVAMRVVDRDTLEQVYRKVWERAGTKGDLVRFLGQ
jgi:hypothetical protein